MAARRKTTAPADVAENVVETPVETVDTTKAKTTKQIMVEPLVDTDEIEVVSLIPNVSYKDSKTNDMYEWDDVGHVEYMDFGTLKNMWRNAKGYFRNMWLKPLDERVIKQFGLTSTFENYEYLMNQSTYVRKNISKFCDAIASAPNGLKYTVCNRVKALVMNGDISDIAVIKALDKELGMELSSLV